MFHPSPEDRKAEVEIQLFLATYPFATRADACDARAHKISGGACDCNPLESPDFLARKARYEAIQAKSAKGWW